MSSRRRSARAPRWSALVAPALLALIACSCGLGIDEDPRALDLGETTTTVLSSPSEGRVRAVLYFVREGTLLPSNQELPDRSVESIVSALVQAPSSDGQSISGLGTSVPAGTEVIGVTRSGEEITIDLSAAFDNVVGLSRQQAIGQIVMSVTQQLPAAQLVFQIDGKTLTVSSPARGDRTVVGACDFSSLVAGIDEAVTVGLQGEELEELARRRAELAEQCLASRPG